MTLKTERADLYARKAPRGEGGGWIDKATGRRFSFRTLTPHPKSAILKHLGEQGFKDFAYSLPSLIFDFTMGEIIKSQKGDAVPHAFAAYSEWIRLQNRRHSRKDVLVNGRELTIADVLAVSLHNGPAKLTDDPLDLELVSESVAFLARELEAGNVIYGVNTGFGGSADTRTQDFERLQSAAVQHLNVGILLKADKTDPGSDNQENGLLRSHALPTPIVKAAMLIRCNSLMRGHSGVRVSVIESVMKLLSLNMTPVVPLRGSISASGDLSTLSHIAGAIEGNPDIFVKVVGEDGKTKILPASETLKVAKIDPVRLQAKEGLGITNGTAPSCAAACLAIDQANQLALLAQLLTAMGTEALNGNSHNYHPFISAIRPHPGQAEVTTNILHFLSGSKICPPPTSSQSIARVGLAQDRYSLRTAPQWLGPQLEDLLLATRQVTTEINSTTDNPLIEVVPPSLANSNTSSNTSRMHHGGNFQAAALTSAMEKTLLALQNIGRLLYAQSAELINNATNKGLPPNLSLDDPSASFTCKGFDVNMAAYAAELAYLAKPVSAHVQVAEMANQSVNSMALVAARYALEAVEVVSLMAATYVYVLCQALDLRCLGLEFRERLGEVVRGVVAGCFLGGEKGGKREEEVVSESVRDAVLARWDQLSHLDLGDRCRTAVNESLGTVLETLAGCGASLEGVREYQGRMAAAMETCYAGLRVEFLRSQTTTDYISSASRVVYDFVRKDLNIPLNRGIEDHPPLLLGKVEEARRAGTADGPNGHVASGEGENGDLTALEEELALRGRTLGTMSGEIYEAVRGGELHDRIMKFGEESGIWGQ
ncbi:L-Aspartase-like protein [Chaetomium fimeti]|uniref:L-Aspartase-like protein n=1 Tax=Chaetomium fimeti TaxID=1854472 RepID=A0AAE0HMR9_9PEZI|nr:L-Aspartase-like protein [Chaetomium fimeti]